MPHSCHSQVISALTALSLFLLFTLAQSGPTATEKFVGAVKRVNNPPSIDWCPASAPEDGPPSSAAALRDTKYLPVQIGGIIAAYGISLVLVAITLLSLAKKRREHIQAGNEEVDFDESGALYYTDSPSAASPLDHFNPQSHLGRSGSPPNFSYPSPKNTQFNANTLPHLKPYICPSPISSVGCPGVDSSVDQSVVAADRKMAQSQLEAMYKHVMEHEDAKQRGIELDSPLPRNQQRASASDKSGTSPSSKDTAKPGSLNLVAEHEGRTQSRTSSFFAALRSSRKKAIRGVNISPPIMTPQSATFPRHELREMNTIPHRNYAPPPPPPLPPVPTDQTSFGPQVRVRRGAASPTSCISPGSVPSIDERINPQPWPSSSSNAAGSEAEPESATSQTPLVGLPSSPKAGVSYPSLLSSPKPGARIQRANAPSVVRTGGHLPLRAYEPALASPSATPQVTKQTVFERRGPVSPTTGRTPMTAGAVPYSPYQPFTPLIPITPSLVTKEDRKRMRKLIPKTPTTELVKSSDEMW
ncbi:uncharacterized protein MAM_00750 [Metarhizium album ARSEF 1941]|uniref:Uncharacterized protein n=1 Tax=Metarhizium album (strain ARSEF 1941) TaxID=1081103 RepID=A0A0B2X5X5_METAS|nr:uncharacterized protein MAM_00750 [Metarhizium album ARSEF 1941]KHO01749.1 hypothetical protein MAM_00750 [Metarhizium album ARSEF 1941]